MPHVLAVPARNISSAVAGSNNEKRKFYEICALFFYINCICTSFVRTSV